MFKRRPERKRGDASRFSGMMSPARHVGTAVAKVGGSAEYPVFVRELKHEGHSVRPSGLTAGTDGTVSVSRSKPNRKTQGMRRRGVAG